MAFYLVTAKLKPAKRKKLHKKLEEEAFKDRHPFGKALTHSLIHAKYDPEAEAVVWEEEDYCSPPLAQEREAVLDHYFQDLKVKKVARGDGWEQIRDLPSLWENDG